MEVEGETGARRSTFKADIMSDYEGVTTTYGLFVHGLELGPGNHPCLGVRGGPENKYVWTSYTQVHDRATCVGSGLVHLGCDPSQKTFIGIYAPNSIEWDLTDLACRMYNMISVPIYDTHGPDGCVYIINHADICTVVCNKAKLRFLFDNVDKCACLKNIVKIGEPISDNERTEAAKLGLRLLSFEDLEETGANSPHDRKPSSPDDIFTICYTSGTTGTPKGVVLSNRNLVANVAGALYHYEQCGIKVSVTDVVISYLPLAHMYERLVRSFMYARGGSTGYFGGDMTKLVEDIQELKPTIFPTVPRLLNRIYDKVMAGVSQQSRLKAWMFGKALRSKEEDVKRGIIRGNTLWDRLVFAKIQGLLGGRVRIVVCGSAPVSSKVLTFMRCCLGECRIMEGYGQTECTACATSTLQDTSAGHVGIPLPCNFIKLVDSPENNCYAKDNKGEVCFKGAVVFQGYWKDPVKTAEVLDSDGWLHSGDIGEWLPDGTLRIIDRKKHIFKLSQGEYVAPEKIENVYSRSPFVAQVFVYGDSYKSHVVGIVVPDEEVLLHWAKQRRITGSFTELCQSENVKKAVLEDMTQKASEANLNSFEQVRAILLHPEPFSIDNGLLTPTLKAKRPVLRKYFEQKLQELYEKTPEPEPRMLGFNKVQSRL